MDIYVFETYYCSGRKRSASCSAESISCAWVYAMGEILRTMNDTGEPLVSINVTVYDDKWNPKTPQFTTPITVLEIPK